MSHQSSVARSQGEGTDHLSQAREEDQASQQSESSHQHHEYSQQPEPHHATPSQRHYQTLRTQQIQFDDYSAPGEPAPMDQSLRCLVVVEDGRKLALSFFDEEKNEILVEETTNSGLEAIERVMEHFLTLSCPNLVLVSKKIVANESLLEIITRGGPTTTATATATDPAAESTTAEMPAAIPYRQIKSADMEVNACRSLILQKLQVLSLARQQRTSPNYDPRRQFQTQGQYRTFQPSNYHSLASLVDFDCKAQVQSLGALLSFLQNTIFRLHDSGLITINDIKPAASTLYMHLSPATYSALHIFATEHHPNLAKGNGHSKEGFSLFSLLDRTQNKGGRQQLREWMLQPLLDIEAITERQDIVELFTRPELEAIAGSLLQLLKQVGAVDAILSRLQKVAANPQDFCTLSKTFSAAIAIASILDSEILGGIERGVFGINELNMKPITLLESILNRCHVEVLHELLVRITSTVDEEATKEYKHGVVIRRGFHEQLDAWKDQYDHLEDIMEQAGSALWDRYPVFNSKLTVVFVPQVGFLVALPQRIVFGDIGQPAIDLPADFTHVFNQDEETFFKNVDMLELDQRIGDLDGLIKDTEGMIVTDLEESILDSEAELRETFKALSELDCLLSFASCAVDFKYTRPSMIEKEQNTVYIKEGRHPLQEIISEGTFVSNFTKIDDNARLNIITGPNFSGKSCYMRQVGTMVFMAHIGSFIPCTKAVISITDQISARISSIESCAVPQSSFQLDLTEMAAILRKSTKHSLVLIDEFGKGTSPASGIAVLVAALETLAGLGSKVVCTTHFLEIFSLEILGQITSVVKPFRMAMRLPKSTCEEACPLFRLEDGVSASSAGLVCAEKAGLDPSILQRAEEIIAAIKNGLSIKPITAREQPSRIACSRNQRKMLRLLFGVESWEEAEAATVRDLIVSIARM